jgi:hypothetical protein
MAFKHVNASTQTVASILHEVDKNARPQTPITIYNGNAASIFIGDSAITISGATIGRTIANGVSQTFYVSSGDVIYGISLLASTAGSIVITYSV